MRKRLLITLGILGMILPMFVQAKELTLSAQLTPKGEGAYLAIYLTNSAGVYQRTLWVAGKKKKYFKHLTDWARGSGMSAAQYDGMTGASIKHNQELQITVNLDDAFIDSGYQIRVDAAVEDLRDHPADIIAPLTTQGAGIAMTGQGYVHSFTYRF